MKRIALILGLILALFTFSAGASACPYCGAPGYFTGERGNNYSNSWDVYQCSNGHRYDVPNTLSGSTSGPRNNCPYCGAPAYFTGERGNNYGNWWDVYQCTNGHRYNVPD